MRCRRCIDGWIIKSPQQAGYERVHAWDTASAKGWLSPGGERCMVSCKANFTEVRQLCNCRRRAWNYPPIPESSVAGRSAARM